MSAGLSYLCQRLVLEYIKPNKRIQISSQCLIISQLEKLLPFHLERLEFDNNLIKIDNIKYEIEEHEEELEEILTPGDIRIGPNPRRYISKYTEITYTNLNSGKSYAKRVPLVFHEAMKRLGCALFEGRKDIRVNILRIDIYDDKVLRLPVGFLVRPGDLITGFNSPQDFLAIIHSASFPLRRLKIWLNTPENLELPMLKTAEHVIINGIENENFPSLPFLHNRFVTFDLIWSPDEQVFGLIREWLNCKARSTVCLLKIFDRDETENLLNAVKIEFGGEISEREDTDESMLTDSICISLPMTPTTVLILYGIEKEEDFYVRMEVLAK
ncbi:hypothetical protein GCK72_008110 [Caenorhabditis remanei]|uniref:F-box associated domain-containing protein n=1 Tax=Caenorhabditis remanei TaxID=31234 RepID=A0A6A5HJU2_CAERE|nr:hypothetical protein GCK72_008110 [Caenorhabditis remanei]KAF1768148.1 hypothetical protein GCK72_008110 [Caenorhabditis remanei]